MIREKKSNEKMNVSSNKVNHRRLLLVFYDMVILFLVCILLLVLDLNDEVQLTVPNAMLYYLYAAVCVIGVRYIGKVYHQVWRYSRVDSYLLLMICDGIACAIYVLLVSILRCYVSSLHITVLRAACVVVLGFSGSIAIRFAYVWVYERVGRGKIKSSVLKRLIARMIWLPVDNAYYVIPDSKIRIAIVGAGRVGAMLAEELLANPSAAYTPVCFIDVDREKIGRKVAGILVLQEDENIKNVLETMLVQELVFAIPGDHDKRQKLYNRYKEMGLKIKEYSFPIENTQENGKRIIREFEIEELLFRQQINFLNEETKSFYRDKVVLVSGGGGSIGSEFARQIAGMQPKQLVLLDIYENNVYDIQQEMQILYGSALNLVVEIASIRDKKQLDKVFRTYRPEIVLHAAAHKHVPLMEHNCSEAVKNNVFGTLNIVDVAEKYGVKKFIMVSTDKAVNPTNVMGASKRLCEMIVLSRAMYSKTAFSCTRFGNVLGSNGSVIPLFKKQIANGGPITLTDRRIIRYFMTIPEAAQLVLTSGAMANNGELFVLDMGRPIRILDLAENMIRLSGLEPYKDIDIVETGLRPGEKLYEELLIKTETLRKTENNMIFVEQDAPLSSEEIDSKLRLLEEAVATDDDERIRTAMKKAVPTFHSAERVNQSVRAE